MSPEDQYAPTAHRKEDIKEEDEDIPYASNHPHLKRQKFEVTEEGSVDTARSAVTTSPGTNTRNEDVEVDERQPSQQPEGTKEDETSIADIRAYYHPATLSVQEPQEQTPMAPPTWYASSTTAPVEDRGNYVCIISRVRERHCARDRCRRELHFLKMEAILRVCHRDNRLRLHLHQVQRIPRSARNSGRSSANYLLSESLPM